MGDDDNVRNGPRYDVWVCQGRICTSRGADDVTRACSHDLEGEERARLHRGGCYGLCDLGPNVVVRRHVGAEALDESDRLTLSGAANEFVSCGVDASDVPDLLRSFLDDDQPLLRLSRAVKEASMPPTSTIEARMRALREKRRTRDP